MGTTVAVLAGWRGFSLSTCLGQTSELPDIKDDHGRGIVLHLKKNCDGSNDAEANALITGFTEVAWGPRQPEIDLTHDADQVGPIFSFKDQ
jgi:hypothetical protein